MRICVVGAGAIGSLLGGRLAIAGNDVALLTRGDHLEVIRRDGLRLIDSEGAETIVDSLEASSDLADFGPQDLVILALKAHQIAGLAASLEVLYDTDTVVLPIQNGVPWWFFYGLGGEYDGRRLQSLDPDGLLEHHIPAERIVGSIAYPAASRLQPGVVEVVEGDQFPVGELDGTRSERAQAIAELLTAAGFRSRVLRDIRAHIWVKAWGNLAFNPISALTGATLAEIGRYPATRSLAVQMMEEAAAIAEELDIRLLVTIEQRIDAAEAVGDHKTSMLQDLEAGRELELEPLVGAFVELGDMTSTPTPTIDAVYACAKLRDATIRGADWGDITRIR